MGKDVIVAAKEAEENLIHSENSWQYKLKNIGDHTAKAIETTWLKTKELSRSIPLFKNSHTDKNQPRDDQPTEVDNSFNEEVADKILDTNTETGTSLDKEK